MLMKTNSTEVANKNRKNLGDLPPYFPFKLGIKEISPRRKLVPVELLFSDNNVALMYPKRKKDATTYPATNDEAYYYDLLLYCKERDVLNHWYNCKIRPYNYSFREEVYMVGSYSVDYKNSHNESAINWFQKDKFDRMTIVEIQSRADELDTLIAETIERIKSPNKYKKLRLAKARSRAAKAKLALLDN